LLTRIHFYCKVNDRISSFRTSFCYINLSILYMNVLAWMRVKRNQHLHYIRPLRLVLQNCYIPGIWLDRLSS